MRLIRLTVKWVDGGLLLLLLNTEEAIHFMHFFYTIYKLFAVMFYSNF